MSKTNYIFYALNMHCVLNNKDLFDLFDMITFFKKYDNLFLVLYVTSAPFLSVSGGADGAVCSGGAVQNMVLGTARLPAALAARL